MRYGDAVLSTIGVLGVMATGFAVTISAIVAFAIAIGGGDHRWYVRVLAGLYVVAAFIFGIATIVWSVSKS